MGATRSYAVALLTTCVVVVTGCAAPPIDHLEGTPAPEAESVPTAVPTRGPAPQLVINPQPAPQSGQVHVAGAGFAPGEIVSIEVADTGTLSLGDVTTASDGAFAPATLTLPDQLQSGPHTLQAVGQTSQRTSTGTLWIRAPQPWLVMDNYDVPQYGDLGLVAGGFEPMDSVQVSLAPTSGPSIDLARFTTDQAGNGAWLQVKLPRASAGTYSLVLHGQASSAELTREMHITPLKPVVELSPWAGPPGLPVQLNVRGFAPSEQVKISINGVPDNAPVVAQADDYGNLWGAGPVRIPQSAAVGSVTINLVGDDSGAIATADFKVLAPKPWLELTNWFGAPGAPVGFGGGGWIAGEKVSIRMGGATSPVVVEAVTDDGGWLKDTAVVYIPLDVSDNVIFVATGDQSHLVCAATFTVVFPFGLHPQPTTTPTG